MLCTLILMLFAIVAVTACIGCWLMPPALIFDWFMFHYWAGSVLIMPFIAAYFNELVSSSTLTATSCHSARRVYPELQDPLFYKAKENLLPQGRRCPKGGWGGKGNHPENSSLSLNILIQITLMENHDHWVHKMLIKSFWSPASLNLPTLLQELFLPLIRHSQNRARKRLHQSRFNLLENFNLILPFQLRIRIGQG